MFICILLFEKRRAEIRQLFHGYFLFIWIFTSLFCPSLFVSFMRARVWLIWCGFDTPFWSLGHYLLPSHNINNTPYQRVNVVPLLSSCYQVTIRTFIMKKTTWSYCNYSNYLFVDQLSQRFLFLAPIAPQYRGKSQHGKFFSLKLKFSWYNENIVKTQKSLSKRKIS